MGTGSRIESAACPRRAAHPTPPQTQTVFLFEQLDAAGKVVVVNGPATVVCQGFLDVMKARFANLSL